MAFPSNNTMIAAAGGLVSESSIYNRAIEATALVGASTNNVISPSSTVQQLVTAAASLLQDDGGYLEAVRAHYALDIYNKLGNSLPFLKLTTAARLALTPAGVGQWVYDTDLNRYFYWNGTGWLSAGAGGSSNTQVIYNDAGALVGDATFTFNKTTKLVSATAVTTTGAVNVGTTLGVTGIATFTTTIIAGATISMPNAVGGLGGAVRYVGSAGSTSNYFINMPTGGTFTVAINEGSVLNLNSASLYPATDNSISCGKSGNRFTEYWGVAGAINTSDRDAKDDIVPLPVGLDFIKALKPVQFKFKDTDDVVVQQPFVVQKTRTDTVKKPVIVREEITLDDGTKAFKETEVVQDVEVQVEYNETEVRDVVVSKGQTYHRNHWGFIAQDVKAVLDKYGIDSGVFVDATIRDGQQLPGQRYALREQELISVLVNGLQELAARVEKLEGR